MFKLNLILVRFEVKLPFESQSWQPFVYASCLRFTELSKALHFYQSKGVCVSKKKNLLNH